MSPESTLQRELVGPVAVYRVKGAFDRAGAWALRDHIERDPAEEILLDFTVVRDFSDLAVAVLAHGLTSGSRRVTIRGVRERQLRILHYCGVALDDRAALPVRSQVGAPSGAREPALAWQPQAPDAQ